ncbi:MAG: EpsG family protein [Bacteroidales bacterium]|nr:EpsG family protein [Bacteroidales bacterium]
MNIQIVTKLSIKKLLTICFILIVLFSGLFFVKFSPDYNIYYSTLNYNIKQFDLKQYEPIHWLIIFFNQIIFKGNVYTFCLIYDILIMLLFTTAIKKYSLNFLLSFIIFLFLFWPNFGLIQIRQGAAVGLFMLSIEDIIKRNAFGYYLKIILAILFHYSAIILIPFYFLKSTKINRLIYLLLPILGLLFYKFFFTLNFFIKISQFLPEPMSLKLINYINYFKLEGTTSSINRINFFNLFSISLLFIYYFFLVFSKFNNNYEIFFLKLLCWSLFTWFGFGQLPVLSFRITNFLYPSIIFLLPFISIIFKQKKIINAFIYTWSFIMFINMYLLSSLFVIK